jgi:hypothetical protein
MKNKIKGKKFYLFALFRQSFYYCSTINNKNPGFTACLVYPSKQFTLILSIS